MIFPNSEQFLVAGVVIEVLTKNTTYGYVKEIWIDGKDSP
jgi:hypothetical protein